MPIYRTHNSLYAYLFEWEESKKCYIPLKGDMSLPMYNECEYVINNLKKYMSNVTIDEIAEYNLNIKENEKQEKIKNEIIEKEKSIGFVYIVKSGMYFKIGKSKKPKERLKAYTEMPGYCCVVSCGKCFDYDSVELELHEMFKEKRYIGEWFELDKNDVQVAIDYILNKEAEK